MAATLGARRLTEAHRLAQARLAARAVLGLRAAWRLLDPEDLDGSIERWLRVASPVVTSNRAASARLAATYVAAFKKAELGSSAVLRAALADMIPPGQVSTSLTVTGPVAIKQAMTRGSTLASAVEAAEASNAASGLRLVLGGGRDTIFETARPDKQCIGWARVTSGRPCSFCAMVAARGAVYWEGSAKFQAHDACLCSAEPVYRDDSAMPPGSRRWAQMWDEASAGDGDTVSNFRRLVEAA